MFAAAAIPPMSAPTLNVLATTTRSASAYATGRGSRLRISAARPSPVTIEMRAHIPWIDGHHRGRDQRQPQQRVAGRRAGDRICRDSGGIVVRSTGDEARTEDAKKVGDAAEH